MSLPAALIFLDYDGVLQTPRLRDWRDFEFLPAFERVLRDFPTVGVVLTTTHRLGRSLDTLRRVYSEDIRAQIVGATPDLICGDADCGRYEEIQQYLREAGRLDTPWVALDDIARLYPRNCPELILCSPYGGFDEMVEEALRARLTTLLEKAVQGS